MIPLNLTDSEFQSLQSIGDKVGDLTVMQTLEFHGNLKLVKDAVAAERERSKLVSRGGRRIQRVACIPPDTFNKLSKIAYGQGIVALQNLLASFTFPIQLAGCRFVAPPPGKGRVAEGDTIVLNMDTLVDGKDVTVTALDSNDVVLSDPAPQTVQGDVDGLARVEMIVPVGYGQNKIKFRIAKEIVALNEFGTHAAVSDGSEVHNVTVT